ncbi:hypothetical protein [Butyrivibrio proteoclasticus]|uniref:hypothetical protein n=1 Tax=Butyrivibrio proteoclasticus TaxID=43305 RepID=UPI000479556B|nr:hypothetical protein [Butyrivibrio proteoclasticus]
MKNAVNNVNETYDEVLNMWCSPIIKKDNGEESFVVHISSTNNENSKFCGIQLPEFHLTYNRGFEKEDFKEILELVSSEYDSLLIEARDAEPSNDWVDDMVLV